MLSCSLSLFLQPEGGTGGDAVAVLGAAVGQLLQQGSRLSVGAEPSPGAAVTGVKLGREQTDGAVQGPGSQPAPCRHAGAPRFPRQAQPWASTAASWPRRCWMTW